MAELITECERCGKVQRTAQPKGFLEERSQGGFYCVVARVEDQFFYDFTPLTFECEQLCIDKRFRQPKRGEEYSLLMCGECREKIVKGLEKLVVKFNEEYRKLFFGKD